MSMKPAADGDHVRQLIGVARPSARPPCVRGRPIRRRTSAARAPVGGQTNPADADAYRRA